MSCGLVSAIGAVVLAPCFIAPPPLQHLLALTSRFGLAQHSPLPPPQLFRQFSAARARDSTAYRSAAYRATVKGEVAKEGGFAWILFHPRMHYSLHGGAQLIYF